MSNTHNATNTLIIHHSADMDGISSALIAKRTMHMIEQNKSITYNEEFVWNQVGYNYGKDPEVDTWLKLINDYDGSLMYNHIQFIDCTPPIFFIEKCIPYIVQGVLTMDIFDHHKTAHDDIQNYLISNEYHPHEIIRYFFDAKYCGSYIYWDSIISSTWIFDTYGFLFNKPIENQEHNLMKLKHYFGGKPKNVSEYKIIKDKIVREIVSNFNTPAMYNFFGTISKWDTWGWYGKTELDREFKCLHFNEGFMDLWYNSFKENLNNMYNHLFSNGELYTNSIQNFISRGREITTFNTRLAEQTKHELISFNEYNFAVINRKANYYDTENIKNLYCNDFSSIKLDAVLYYSVSIITGKSNLSLRSLHNKINCSSTIKELTLGNGGGHSGAAGGQIDIVRLLEVLKPMELPEPPILHGFSGTIE